MPECTEIHDRTRERLSGNVRERAFSSPAQTLVIDSLDLCV
jgi:hypothetical protein